MEIRRIAYTRPNTEEEGFPEPFDGGVSIVGHPASKERIEQALGREISDNEYQEITWETSVPSYAIDPQYIDEVEIRKYLNSTGENWRGDSFRDAFKIEGSSLVVDMEKARIIHMRRIKEMQQKKLTEMGFPQPLNPQIEAAIIDEATRNELQRLRDIPQSFDLSTASTPEQLASLWPMGIDVHPIYTGD